jgi:cellulose synthase (UDP-forming)
LVWLFVVIMVGSLPSTSHAATAQAASDDSIRDLDELSALWSFYKHSYVRDGRVISPDEGHITTSEGQGYAMLRAVWSSDRRTFDSVWRWTRQNLERREDHLFAWKWRDRVIDRNAATDADTDIALALVLASRKFKAPAYLEQAKTIIHAIWDREILITHNKYFVTGGNWAPGETYPTIHVAYLAPYAYEVFSQIDPGHPWKRVIETSYDVLEWIYADSDVKLPPMLVYVDKATGELMRTRPGNPAPARFSYDAFPIFWRVALDASWFGRDHKALRRKMLAFFESEWETTGRFYDTYSLDGQALSRYEGQVLYATVHALASQEQAAWARDLRKKKLDAFAASAQRSVQPYYLQNWLWFDRAFDAGITLHFAEFLGFLRPFHFERFSAEFPWWIMGAALALYPLARWFFLARIGFIALATALCARYLWWRLFHTLNFIEAAGPFISIALWAAETYCFTTVVLLIVQVGLRGRPSSKEKTPEAPAGFLPSVDILIPIYSEPLAILESTLIAAVAMDYPNKRVHVCDDSHQEAVKELTERLGGIYVKGPKKHAKAGNMNNALTKTSGDLVVIFDTDHIPVKTFLKETVPYFADPKMGFVQTPHHFFNEDIFQRAFGTRGRIPNEQDMFNHAIQDGRNSWGGSFFVGSGAVFRRSAVDEVGGFKYLSITEDIHTSQHLHAKGWKSAFVDKDLAVGLTAENLASYLVQRRRWMLGCLQIFFKNNPLLQRGLNLRQRIGYFASLYYFFFPAARVVFLLAPMLFLWFHWHPVFSEISSLLAYLLPFIILLPLLSSVLMPAWPRMFWGTVYENVVALPLARSMFDLFLPKNLGFKVTPKGITSEKRQFDYQSSMLTLIVAGLTLLGIFKGFWEFTYFEIEKDAYFFNLSWAIYNFLSLLMALAVAWENPQRRADDRIATPIPFEFHGPPPEGEASAPAFVYSGVLRDISMSGIGLSTAKEVSFPAEGEVRLKDGSGLILHVDLVYNEHGLIKGHRVGLRFKGLSAETRTRLRLHLFASPERWSDAHDRRVRTNFGMGVEFFKGNLRVLRSIGSTLFSNLKGST